MKQALRKEIRRRLSALSAESLRRKSLAACEALTAEEAFRRARAVMIYLSTAREVNTASLTAAARAEGKILLAPKVAADGSQMIAVELDDLDDGLVAGPHGILEPAGAEAFPLEKIDLIVIPAVAYDRKGNRLGHGGGHYDRFLARRELKAVRCGLAFAEQIVPSVPTAPHDRPVQMIVTDEEVLYPAP